MHRSCAKFSMFSSQFPSAAWREVAVSDMSSKNWDGMRSMWDLCPTISKIIKRRRTCRRRSLLRVLWKSAPSPCERCGHVEAEWGTKSPATFFCHSDDVNRSQTMYSTLHGPAPTPAATKPFKRPSTQSLQLSKVLLMISFSFLYWNLLGYLQETVRGMYMHCYMTSHEF